MSALPELPGAWVLGLGLFGLLLALVWRAWFPGLTDSAPEREAPADSRAPGPPGPPCPPGSCEATPHGDLAA
jgi:hypothetical protein